MTIKKLTSADVSVWVDGKRTTMGPTTELKCSTARGWELYVDRKLVARERWGPEGWGYNLVVRVAGSVICGQVRKGGPRRDPMFIPDEAESIRKLRAAGKKYEVIARLYPASRRCLTDVVNRKRAYK